MSESIHRHGGPYLRVRVSSATIKQVALFAGNLFQFAVGADSVVTGIKLKKAIERREKITSVLNTAKVSTEIAGLAATAFSELVKK